jgi:hypothetical protein
MDHGPSTATKRPAAREEIFLLLWSKIWHVCQFTQSWAIMPDESRLQPWIPFPPYTRTDWKVLPPRARACGRQIRGVRWTSFCFSVWRASWNAHVLQMWRQSKNVWQRFCDRFLKRPLLTVSRSFMNVANSVLWRMAIILKANKVNWFVYSVLFVFWYHSPNVLDTPLIY